LCLMLGHNAVHAAMAGRTNMVVGGWRRQFTHVPIALAVAARRKIDPDGRLWSNVLSCTGQPHPMAKDMLKTDMELPSSAYGRSS